VIADKGRGEEFFQVIKKEGFNLFTVYEELSLRFVTFSGNIYLFFTNKKRNESCNKKNDD